MTALTNSGQSVWLATVQIEDRPALVDDLRVDVCVVGAGIAGMTTAYLLAKEGKSVAVIEDGSIGGGMTGFTTAHLISALDDRYFQLERYHGEDGARLAAASHSAAIDTIERIVAEEQIDCDFRRLDGYLFAPPNDDSDDIEREYDAALRAGLKDVRKVESAPIAGFDTGPALLFPRQGQFHPLKYLDGLARAFERLGGKIFCRTHARAVSGGDNACVITEDGSLIGANAIVVATNAPVNDLFAIHTKQAPYTSYVIGAHVPKGTVVTALYWDTRQSADESESGDAPYHYVRLAERRPQAESGSQADGGCVGDLLIVGGEDHKSGQAHDGAERFGRLESWARERWPQLGEVLFRWSGQVMEPNDGMAFIGHNPIDNSNIYVATGDSGTGMTHGTIAGMLLTDLICSRPNPWQKLYDPGRVTLRAAGDFVRENVNVAVQYAKGFLGPGEAGGESDIAPGEGAVIRKGIKKVAVYRDGSGGVHEMSAVCPHLGCVVAWNAVEKTWDCPCHGSRFDCLGAVVNGPANEGLEGRLNSREA